MRHLLLNDSGSDAGGAAFGRTAGIAVALVLIVLGLESTVSTVRDWLFGTRSLVSTGIALPVAGIGILVGGRVALRASEWALRVQFVVSVALTVMVLAVAWPGAEGVHPVPSWRPVAAGILHAALALGSLSWISGCRKRRGPRHSP